MTAPNKDTVRKGAAYIYIEAIIASFSGYLLWLVLSKLTLPEVIGTSSTVISIASIFTTLISFGIPVAIPRFLGKMFSERNFDDAKSFIISSLLLVSMGILIGSIVILFLRHSWILDDLDFSLIVLSIVLMGSTAIANLFRYIIISSFQTRTLVTRQILGSIVKIILSVLLILVGVASLGIAIGYAAGQITAAILAAVVIIQTLKSSTKMSGLHLRQSFKQIFAAGVPNWIPASITIVGAQLGTVIVFGAAGSSQAGSYFIAFSIFSAIITVTSALLSAAFPALSAMRDGRKRFSWRIIKMSLIVSLPLASSLIFYSKETLGLFGQGYINGSTSLEILLLSILPATVCTGVNTLVYSYGNYKQVLVIGLALSVPRVLLYFIAVPIFYNTGAAVSYTIGSMVGVAVSSMIARKIGLILFWKNLVLMLIIPTALSFILYYFHVQYIIGIAASILISYVLYLKLRIVTREDVQDSVGVLPPKISNPAIKILNMIGKKLDSSY
jgi:O-antigen/teichoic acid export membrane protein